MATLGIAFFLSLTAASLCSVKAAAATAGLAFAAFFGGLLVPSVRKNKGVMTCLLAVMAAFSMYALHEQAVYLPLQQWDGRTARLTLQTLDWVQERSAGLSVTAKVTQGGLPAGTRVTLWFSGSEMYPEPYDLLTGEFTLSTPSDSRDGQPRGYSKAQKVFLNASSASYRETGLTLSAPERRPWFYQILKLRRAIRADILGQPGWSDVSGLMAGVAFGFRADLPAKTTADFRAAGVTHLLAVSGMHTALIAQLLLALFIRLRVPRRGAALLAAGGVALFMAVVGFSASVLRAGIMSVIFLAGLSLGREADGLNSLGASVLFITMVNPYAVNDVGLLLSFSATLGLLTLLPRMQRAAVIPLRERGGGWRLPAEAIDAAAVTLAATIPTLPVILWSFGLLSVVSPLANLLMVLPSSVVMVGTALGAAFSLLPLPRFLGAAAYAAAGWTARYLDAVAGWLAAWPYASVWVDSLYLLAGIPAALGLCWLGWRLLGRRGVKLAALWSVIALCLGTTAWLLLTGSVTRVEVLNAGNASAVLLRRGGHTGVVWIGEDSAVAATRAALTQRGVREVDFLILPAAEDECAYAASLLTRDVRVDCLALGAGEKYEETLRALPAGRRVSLEEGTLSFWNDGTASLKDGWLTVTLGQTRLLFCPPDGNAAALAAGERQGALAVFTGAAPAHAAALETGAAVLNCRSADLAAAVKAVPRSPAALYDTAGKTLVFRTRGRGDLSLRPR